MTIDEILATVPYSMRVSADNTALLWDEPSVRLLMDRAAAAERERAAKIVENILLPDYQIRDKKLNRARALDLRQIAAAIRAGEEPGEP